jgi:hypothetical protein
MTIAVRRQAATLQGLLESASGFAGCETSERKTSRYSNVTSDSIPGFQCSGSGSSAIAGRNGPGAQFSTRNRQPSGVSSTVTPGDTSQRPCTSSAGSSDARGRLSNRARFAAADPAE